MYSKFTDFYLLIETAVDFACIKFIITDYRCNQCLQPSTTVMDILVEVDDNSGRCGWLDII